MVSDEQFAKVCAYVAAGQREGAALLTGVRQVGNQGYFPEPTILANTNQLMSVVREEIFGPALCASRFDDDALGTVVRQANESPHGLSAGVFTGDIAVAHRVARKLKASTKGINTPDVVDPALLFGGFKQSGWGREMGWEAIELYTEVKSVGIAL